MTRVEAPGKLNLSLLVEPPAPNGYHPLDSLVQTVEWCDILELETVDDNTDQVTVTGADIDPDDNLVVKALREVRVGRHLAWQRVQLEKKLPVAAGLGGGSSDAAATVLAAGHLLGLDRPTMTEIADRLGADVPLFLTGGTLRMGGFGEKIQSLQALDGLAFAIAVPDFGLLAVDVYRRWDEMEGPVGVELSAHSTPPQLRGGMPLRNDLLPAAMSLEPRLSDFMAELRAAWGIGVSLTGSGSACFAYFPDLTEAVDAAAAVASMCAVSRGVDIRGRGVVVLPADPE
jgi:4-diphosphocytidyl-2-C-methyl-D-erythritol kinase